MRMLLSAATGAILAVGVCSGTSAKAPLRGTIVDSGNAGGQRLAVGNNTISSATVNCESKTGCVLMVTAMVETSQGNGSWKICPTVDGAQMNPPCGNQGLLPGGSAQHITGNGWSNTTLTPGSHSVGTVLSITGNNQNLFDWQVSYIFWPVKKM